MRPRTTSRGGAQVGQAGVGAGADEHAVHFRARDRLALGEAHVGERLGLVAGNPAVDADHVLRAGAPGDLRRERRAVDGVFLVEFRARVARQRLPVRERLLPALALGRVAPALEVGEGFLVGRDHADLGAQFDGQVAHRHAAFHFQAADRLARVFHRVAHASRRADFAYQREDQVFRGDAARRRAVEIDAHRLGLLLHDGLRGEHVREFAGADAPGERAERAVGAGMAVAADQQRAGQREAEFGPDDVHDALAVLADVVDLDARLLALDAEGIDHLVGPGRSAAPGAGHGRDHVVHRADGEARAARADAAFLQLLLAALARELVHQVPVDEHQLHAVAQLVDRRAGSRSFRTAWRSFHLRHGVSRNPRHPGNRPARASASCHSFLSSSLPSSHFAAGNGRNLPVRHKPGPCRRSGRSRWKSRKPSASARAHHRRLAGRHHVGEQLRAARQFRPDALELVLRLRRLDEQDVGAGFGESPGALERFVQAEAGARVGARDDEEVLAAARFHRHLDALDRVLERHHAPVRRVAAFLRRFLVLDLDRLHARAPRSRAPSRAH